LTCKKNEITKGVLVIELPNKKYKILYCDPPWSYKTWNAKGGHKSASAHYSTMDVKEICNIPMQKICDKDCILFLWATYPNLPQAFEVIDAWGFKYKTGGFTWVKTYKSGKPFIGLGYWTRANAEICLIATKGKIQRQSKSVSQIVMERPRRHSQKPDIVRYKIIELVGDLPRIELFARERVFGWDSWGLEV
jgi:site-specific DNA-methyltransferase (adenine-specific)